jgi:uncharacterized membrane protein
VAAAAAVAALGGAAALGAVHWVMGWAADRQEMSVGGVSPTTLSVAAWSGGAALTAFLLVCGAVLVRTSVTDRPPRRPGRVVLVGGAVLFAVLGALAVGLAGWVAFAVLMAGCVLIALTLTLYPPAPAGLGAPQFGDADAQTVPQELPQERQ